MASICIGGENAQSQSEDRREVLRGRLLLGAAFLCALAIYLPTLRFGYLLDDDHLIAGNPRMETWASIPYFFRHQLWPGVPYYRPLALTAFLAISKLFGAQPWIFHLYDVCLYLIAASMVYVTARRLEFSPTASGWAALLFAVHPMHLEIGAWITGSTESLLAIPFLAAFCCYVRARQKSEHEFVWIAAALCFFSVALLAKELAIVLPVLLLVWEIVAGKKLAPMRRALRLLPFCLLAVVYSALRANAVGTLSATITPLPLKTEALTIPSIVVFYARQFFVHAQTSFFYDTDYVTTAASPRFLWPCVLLLIAVLACGYAILRKKTTPGEGFCLISCAICLLPSLNFSAFVWRELAHDRYFYLASVFLSLALASILARLCNAGRALRIAAIGIMVGIPVAYTLQSMSQASFYRDEFTGFAHAAKIAPNNLYIIRYLIGNLQDRGRTQEAQEWLARLNQVTPEWWYVYQLAQTSFQNGDLPQAEQLVRRSLALQAQPESHRLLALILESESKCAEAKTEWKLSYYPRPGGLACAENSQF